MTHNPLKMISIKHILLNKKGITDKQLTGLAVILTRIIFDLENNPSFKLNIHYVLYDSIVVKFTTTFTLTLLHRLRAAEALAEAQVVARR